MCTYRTSSTDVVPWSREQDSVGQQELISAREGLAKGYLRVTLYNLLPRHHDEVPA